MSIADSRPLAIFLMGPTASGKTALALNLAERFNVGLISVDSALVYRGFNIGTAKPDSATLRRFPHRLVDVRDFTEPYSAAEFRQDAARAMAEITEGGQTPLLVGGTGLYFRALRYGLSELPAADSNVRGELKAQADAIGWPAMHQRLVKLDSAAADRIKPTDPQRIQRALEVIALTGRPLSEQQNIAPRSFGYRVLKVALIPEPRQLLHARIEQRFDSMLEQGFLDEVIRLRGLPTAVPDLPAWRAVGYRQAAEYLAGDCDFATFRARAIFATRQLAKRQITWLRNELDAITLNTELAHMERAVGMVRSFLAIST